MPQCDKIKIMPEALAIKIAAGEVIERPASVVKELVENSIDAKATDISIYIHDGGRKIIKVVDNGEGMSGDDAVIAFERHATSKLLKEEDLYSIYTMGFRGEALPSIASVSEIILTTKISGEIAGTMVKVKGGNREESVSAGCANGTTVEVRNIFFNTPARLKFMRSISTETGHIYDAITRLALAYPSIRFRLYNNNSSMLDTSMKADLKMRIADIFGRDFFKDIIPVEAGSGALKIHGFIAKPEAACSTTKGLYTYVNNRWIRDRGINHAIANGYRNCLASSALGGSGGGKYPFVVLFITIPPKHVDVNVHPTKCEVRFKDRKDVYELVKSAIEAALAPSYKYFLKTNKDGMPASYGVNESPASYETGPPPAGPEVEICAEPSRRIEFAEPDADTKDLFFRELEVIGQLWLEYLLCQRKDEFYIVDQHAAAERIAFERLKKDYYFSRRVYPVPEDFRAAAPKDGPWVKSQMLLLPQRVEFPLQERDAMEDSMQALKNIGFDIEPFGGNTFIIRAVPDILSGMDCRGLIKGLAGELASMDMSFKIEDKLDAILMRIACHSVIRGRRPLSNQEAHALLEQLGKVDFSANCPHGRPVIKTISRTEVEKMFKRK